MLKRLSRILILSFIIIFAACQGEDKNETDNPINQPNHSGNNLDESGDTNNTDGNHSKDKQTNTNEEGDRNPGEDADESNENAREQENNAIKEKNYDNTQEAINAIDDYEEIEQTNIELGHGMHALEEGAAGHQYISWNEGRWMIVIDFPNDPQYAIEEYEDGKEMAEAIVDYLEENMLPPPEERGVIKMDGFSKNPETSIRWQQGKTVYEIIEEVSDPIEALQLAVDYEKNN